MPSQTTTIGTAGWSYPHWEGIVYPKPHPKGFHPLEYMAQYLDMVEINSSFYRALQPEVTQVWMNRVKDNPRFQFTAKLHQRFTHWRMLQESQVEAFKQGLRPLQKAGKLGALLMQFPWSFRFTAENRDFFIQLRRAFHDFRLVAEMRHSSWMSEEAIGTFLDYKVGFCNIDQPDYTRAMPPTAFLTSPVGYVRLHGRNPANSLGAFGPDAWRGLQHDYLYSAGELTEWKKRIERLQRNAESVYVVFNNDARGQSVVNALQSQYAFDAKRTLAPYPLLCKYRVELEPFHSSRKAAAMQPYLFEAA
jgi:uncharacterized protein YecE (DUF72 family)